MRGSVMSGALTIWQGEAGLEHGLEADAVVEHRRHLLAAEGAPLLGGEVQAESVDREEVVGDELAVADVTGDLGVGLDHSLERRTVEALDAVGHCSGGHGHDPKPTKGRFQWHGTNVTR